MAAAELTTLHKFSGADGAHAFSLVTDEDGVLFVAALNGGDHGKGTILKLSPPAPGQSTWTSETLHSFSAEDTDAGPRSLVMGQDGVLYGATPGGGGSPNCSYGCGTVFKLVPPFPGKVRWRLRVLHRFSGSDGRIPFVAAIDLDGALYGATYGGSGNCGTDDHGCGTVFRLLGRRHQILHSFSGPDGALPRRGVMVDGAGVVYGATGSGGDSTVCGLGCGVVFQLSPRQPGKPPRKYTRLHSFSGKEGHHPITNLILDEHGALYGATASGPPLGTTVFKLSPPAPGEGPWAHEVLHVFPGEEGRVPTALTFGAGGIIFGTTSSGGPNGYGTVFKLVPPAKGETTWQHSILHSFARHDGTQAAALIMGPDGALYGTTVFGGSRKCDGGCGTVFKLTP